LFQEAYYHYDSNKVGSKPSGFIEYRLWTLRKKLSPSKKKYKQLAKRLKTTLKELQSSNPEPLSDTELNQKVIKSELEITFY